MFILFINDISNVIKNDCLKLFADDSNLFVIANSIEKLFKCANEDINAISE